MKKVVALMLSLAMAVSMTACTTGGKTDTTAAAGGNAGTQAAGSESTGAASGGENAGSGKDTVIYAYPNDPESFSPLRLPKSGYSEMTYQVYDCLFTYDSEGNFVPSVCTEVEKVDGSHYKLHLRNDVKFSDGHLMTAEDVVYSLKMYSEDSNSSSWVKYLDMANTKAADDVTVDLALTSEYAFAISTLQNVNLFYQEAYEASSDGMTTAPIGSGPYTLKEYVSGSYALFEARDDYWGEKAQIPNLKVMFIKEASQRTTALQTGEVDCAYDVLSSDYEGLMAEGFQGNQILTDRALNLMFNNSTASICQDPKVRQAIAYATDNEGILQAAYGGYGEICTTCSSVGMINLNDMYIPEDYYQYDLEKAKAAFQEAGVAEGTAFSIMVKSGDSATTTCAEILQQSLQSCGMKAEIKQVEAAVFDDSQKDETSGYDISFNTMNTAGSKSSLDLINLYCFIIPNLHYTNEEGAALSAAAVSTTDTQLIHDNTMKLTQMVCEEVPYYAIASNATLIVSSGDLNEVVPARGGITIRGNYFSWK